MSEAAAAAIAAGVRRSGTSFYLAMRLLPARRRAAMFALYAFCRAVDDVADSTVPAAEKCAALIEWRAEMGRLFAGVPRHPIALALQRPVQDFHLRRADFLAILKGMAMDAKENLAAPDLAMLDRYCDRVASAVGRISVRIFGARGGDADRVAHHLGRALQLTNILRDLGEDGARSRLYLPSELLARHGVSTASSAGRAGKGAPAAVSMILAHPALPLVCRDLAGMAAEHFAKADEAMRANTRSIMRPARIMGGFYRAILTALIAQGWRDLRVRPRLSWWRKSLLALRYFP